jgi:hypothetical protein
MLDIAKSPSYLRVWMTEEVSYLCCRVMTHMSLRDAVVMGGRLCLVIPGRLFAP